MRAILEGKFEDILHNFRCTLHIAKPPLDMLFVMFEAHWHFQKSTAKMTKSANSEACFSEARSERILEPSWVDFETIVGGFGAQNGQQMRSKNDVKKKCEKSHASVYG